MSEVFQWLKSISNGLGLERLAEDFESRGFSTVGSLKYFRSPDLDVLFPTPQKLKMAEKRILETELANLKEKTSNLQPRELFPQNHGSVLYFPTSNVQSKSSGEECLDQTPSTSSGLASPNLTFSPSNPATVCGFTPTISNIVTPTASSTILQTQSSQFSASQHSSTYLDKRQTEMKQDQELMAAKKRSVEELLKEKTRATEDYKESSSRRQKVCSHCHFPGHNKTKCKNGPCNGIANCRYTDKHPEIKSEIQELKRILKDLEKKEVKTKNDYDVFKAARERASSSFFAIMRPRLRSQNAIKYVDRSALDRDLMILKRALGNKVPMDDRMDWELPYIIERYKRANVDIFST